VCTAGDVSRLTMMRTLGPPASPIRQRGARRAELAIPRTRDPGATPVACCSEVALSWPARWAMLAHLAAGVNRQATRPTRHPTPLRTRGGLLEWTAPNSPSTHVLEKLGS